MQHNVDIALIIGITAIVLLVIILALGLLYSRTPETTKQRPRKASLPPLHGGYKALDTFQVERPHPHPPKAPEGAGGCSH
jgi:hypothetical protein